MWINEILILVGELSLFMLGMNLMGNGLEKACGNKMKKILEKLIIWQKSLKAIWCQDLRKIFVFQKDQWFIRICWLTFKE